jgi:hypothetical protein
MNMNINLTEIIQCVIAILAFLVSLWSLKQSKDAEVTSQRALKDSLKDYMPLIRFSGNFDIKRKSIETLRNELTFDFYNVVTRRFTDDGKNFLEESDKLYCIEAEIENCGKGIVSGISINNFFMQEGNPIAMKKESQDELECFCKINNKCSSWFSLLPEEKIKVNFAILDCNKINTDDDIEEQINKLETFVNGYNNIVIGMNMKIDSINETKYSQDYLIGTFLNKKVTLNSFVDVRS